MMKKPSSLKLKDWLVTRQRERRGFFDYKDSKAIVHVVENDGATTCHGSQSNVRHTGTSDAEDAIRGRDGYEFDRSRLRVELAHGGRGQSFSSDRRSGFGGGGRGSSGGRGGGGSGARFGVSCHSDFRVIIRGLPSSASWQDLKDHMRKARCFS